VSEEEDFKPFQDGMCGVQHVCARKILCCVSQNRVRATIACVVFSFAKKEPMDDAGWVDRLVKKNLRTTRGPGIGFQNDQRTGQRTYLKPSVPGGFVEETWLVLLKFSKP
jgi:hypothetical protein